MQGMASKVTLRIIFGMVFLYMGWTGLAQAQSRIPGDFYPGDAVRIIVWQDPSYRSLTEVDIDRLGIADDYIIDRRGKIFMPLLGDVLAIGKTRAELAEYLRGQYEKILAGLQFVCKPLIRLTVLGEVAQPGSYLVEASESLWQVISSAGGPVPTADLNKITLMRSDKVVAEGLLEVYEKAYSLKEIGVRSGDQLIIPQIHRFSFRTVMSVGTFLMSFVLLYLQVKREVK